MKNMVHGSCGRWNPSSPCMKDGFCTKIFPRQLIHETQSGHDGYPLYRRRKVGEGGFTALMKIKIGNSYQDIEVDNRWIVPYSPFFSKTFQSHVNVEYCNSVKAIKYICKYVNKGSDQAAFGLERQGRTTDEINRQERQERTIDEIDRFQTGRYISSNEAVWQILDFPTHDRYPTVVHLNVHLENEQRVYFTEETATQEVLQPKDTTLTALFKLCQQDDFAMTLLYCDVPMYYTWNKSSRVFKLRVQGTPVEGHVGIMSSDALGRVYTVHPNNHECFFLQLLLHTVAGPTSFVSLKTVGNHVCTTYRQACQERGLLESDSHWDKTLEEAATCQLPASLRNLFSVILTTCGPSKPLELWEKYKEHLSEDVLLQARRQNPGLQSDSCTPHMFNMPLILLEEKTLMMVGK
ncbi:uncharacterized protein LOC142760457 [Rhinoderma darwinii]|uniref:uncharacterized protein LOC142760457 n=1 Tax=Rhinoderma darwinii TaxID=43563 RepID=UPI003F67165C